MILKDVIGRKGSTIVSVEPDAALFDVAKMMHEHCCGSVVVAREGKLLGLVTEKAVVAAYAKKMFDNSTTAADVMDDNIPVIFDSEDVDEAMMIMTRRRQRHVLVQTARGTAGIVSLGDLVKHRFTEIELENRVLRDMARAALVS